jgi:3-oxoacyl-[acyl-carrier-protein] synthase II
VTVSDDPARRVVVTGIGCVSPLGADLESTWEAAVAGRSVAAPITLFDASDYPVRFGAEVKTPLATGDLSVKEVRRTDRCVLLAVDAAGEAVANSGLEVTDANRDRIGVAIGSGIGGLGTLLANNEALVEKGPRRVSPFTIPMGIANMPSGVVSIQHGVRGPNLCHVSACASGAHGLGEAARLIERGDADAMIAGGAEASLVGLAVAGFASMKALSTRNDAPTEASRPFDRGRDGFVVGEGAAVFLLESLAHARARGAEIRAELQGYGASGDASHVVTPEESGAGPILAMQAALAHARLDPTAIDYVNAHATSTPAGDPIEARALRSVFGEHIHGVPVSGTKSMTGHLLGASGALEAAFCVRSLETGLLAPTINLDDPDPECALDHVANKARETRITVALSNSFGFGGANVTLILSALRD